MPDSTLPRQILRDRRTIHDFLPEIPPWENIRPALESAQFAPNHHFTQPWKFYRIGAHTKASIVELNAQLVAQSKGEAAAAKKRERWGEIPGWLVITSKRHPKPLTEKENYAASCCAVQNLMLDLWSQGIGSKWTTGAVTRDPRFYRLLGAQQQHEDVVALLWYGYPARTPKTLRSALDARLIQLP